VCSFKESAKSTHIWSVTEDLLRVVGLLQYATDGDATDEAVELAKSVMDPVSCQLELSLNAFLGIRAEFHNACKVLCDDVAVAEGMATEALDRGDLDEASKIVDAMERDIAKRMTGDIDSLYRLSGLQVRKFLKAQEHKLAGINKVAEAVGVPLDVLVSPPMPVEFQTPTQDTIDGLLKVLTEMKVKDTPLPAIKVYIKPDATDLEIAEIIGSMPLEHFNFFADNNKKITAAHRRILLDAWVVGARSYEELKKLKLQGLKDPFAWARRVKASGQRHKMVESKLYDLIETTGVALLNSSSFWAISSIYKREQDFNASVTNHLNQNENLSTTGISLGCIEKFSTH
jgi:hypothetical protein